MVQDAMRPVFSFFVSAVATTVLLVAILYLTDPSRARFPHRLGFPKDQINYIRYLLGQPKSLVFSRQIQDVATGRWYNSKCAYALLLDGQERMATIAIPSS